MVHNKLTHCSQEVYSFITPLSPKLSHANNLDTQCPTYIYTYTKHLVFSSPFILQHTLCTFNNILIIKIYIPIKNIYICMVVYNYF